MRRSALGLVYLRLLWAALLGTGAISIYCFTYSLEGVTAVPLRLHARLCHAFLVVYLCCYS